jgi:hypothetical protein
MIIWDDAQTISQKLAQDTNSASVTFLNLLMNTGYKEVLAELGRPVTEKTKTTTTVAAQQGYQMPADFNWLKSIKVTVGSTVYTPGEEESQEQWDYLNSQVRSGNIPEAYFVRPRFGFGGTEVQLYPIPSSSGNTITLIYEAIDKDLSVAKYTTGTVAVTNGSATVTGTGTTFTRAMVGRYFQITDADGDGLWYKVAGFTSATVITLENFYQGTTDSSNIYQIAEAFGLPEDLHMLPIYYAVWHYSLFRRDKTRADEYAGLYTVGLQQAKRRYGTKSRGNIIKGKQRLTNSGGSNPLNFPTSIT